MCRGVIVKLAPPRLDKIVLGSFTRMELQLMIGKRPIGFDLRNNQKSDTERRSAKNENVERPSLVLSEEGIKSSIIRSR